MRGTRGSKESNGGGRCAAPTPTPADAVRSKQVGNWIYQSNCGGGRSGASARGVPGLSSGWPRAGLGLASGGGRQRCTAARGRARQAALSHGSGSSGERGGLEWGGREREGLEWDCCRSGIAVNGIVANGDFPNRIVVVGMGTIVAGVASGIVARGGPSE